MLTLPIKLLNDSTVIPSYAYPGDAGLDLASAEHAILKPFERRAVSCGIALEIPEGYAGFVLPRSGLALKHGVSIVNAPGLIDSGYRGEIKVILVNLDPMEPFEISIGDRIGQLVVMETPPATVQVVHELSDASRNENGFGSSGVSR